MNKDPLQYLPVEKWSDLQVVLKTDWLRGISGYTVLETQRRWIEEGLDYGFKVFVPFGDVWNGMVAINEKDAFYEIVVQSQKEDTTKLEEALKNTKLIDWTRKIIIPFAQKHVIKCIQNIVEEVNVDIELILPSETFIFKRQPFVDISLPPETTFSLLSQEHADLVDSKWPHRYPGSSAYFLLLIKAKSGFGLFKNEQLVSWVFINESGNLGHMFTLEEYRRKSYAEILLKLICNILLANGKDVVAFCVKGNVSACKLYKKVGFNSYECGAAWCYLKNKVK